MFRCRECDSTAFQLMTQPGYAGKLEVACNDHQEIVIVADNREFIADLMFMNQFAVCQGCGAIRQWEYHFPQAAEAHLPPKQA